MTPFGINYGTAAQVAAYPGRADLPAQPIWATDTNQLWIVDGTSGKHEIAMKTDLSQYLTQANASSTYLTQANASSTYLTQANASSTYVTKALLIDALKKVNAP